MARQNISEFKIYEESTKKDKYWANLADENILLLTHPHAKPWVDLTGPVIDYVSSATPGLADKRTALTDFLQGEGKTVTVDSDWIRWKLRGTGEVQAVALENLHPGVAYPGAGGQQLQVKLDVEWFVDGDILAPDVAKDCQVLVEGLPIRDGIGFIYNVVVVDRDETAGFDGELLEEGLKWIKMGSAYGEASRGYGSTQFGGMSYIEFQTELTDWGKSVEVTNKAHDLNLRMQAYDNAGNYMGKDYPDQVISMIEAEFIVQYKWEKELMLYYGRSANKNIIDPTSGHYRRIGPGLLEFMEDGNIIPYHVNNFSIDMFEAELQSVWFDRVPPERRNVVVFTGQGGLTLWRDAMTEKFAVSGVRSDFGAFTAPGKSYDPKNYKGYAFPAGHMTEYRSFPFGSIKVEHWPILDSMWLNGSVTHPDTGLPMSSYEFIILDVGLGMGGGSNIQLLKRREAEAWAFECGTWSPGGAIKQGGGSSFVCTGPQRSYQLYATDTFGIRMKDITLSAYFVPSVQY